MIAFLVLVILPLLFALVAMRLSPDSRDSDWSLSHRDTHHGTDGRVQPYVWPTLR